MLGWFDKGLILPALWKWVQEGDLGIDSDDLETSGVFNTRVKNCINKNGVCLQNFKLLFVLEIFKTSMLVGNWKLVDFFWGGGRVNWFWMDT